MLVQSAVLEQWIGFEGEGATAAIDFLLFADAIPPQLGVRLCHSGLVTSLMHVSPLSIGSVTHIVCISHRAHEITRSTSQLTAVMLASALQLHHYS